MAVNDEKLNDFLGQFVTDLGATAAEAGFTRFREAARTPFNIVLEARR